MQPLLDALVVMLRSHQARRSRRNIIRSRGEAATDESLAGTAVKLSAEVTESNWSSREGM
jgi:hypothetical protein